jgi:lysozyme
MKTEYLVLSVGVVGIGAYMLTQKMGGTDSVITSGAVIKARDFIMKAEGYKTEVYKDSGGLPTIGYGHLLLKGESYPNGITKLKAQQLLEQDLKIAAKGVDKYLKVSVNANQKAALISLAYNIGVGAFSKLILLEKVNNREFVAAASRFPSTYITVKGKEVQGLVNRRNAEKILFLS